MKETKQAALLLVQVDDELMSCSMYTETYVSVSRRHGDIKQVGLVCGKVDPGETALEAAIREAKEEIGLVVSEEEKQKIVAIHAGWDSGHWVTTFLYPGKMKLANLVMEHGLLPRAVTLDDLCRPEVSPFWNYNLGIRLALWRYRSQE